MRNLPQVVWLFLCLPMIGYTESSKETQDFEKRFWAAHDQYQTMRNEICRLHKRWMDNKKDPQITLQQGWGTTRKWKADINNDGKPETIQVRFDFAVTGIGVSIKIFHPTLGMVLSQDLLDYSDFCFLDMLDEYPGKEVICWRYYRDDQDLNDAHLTPHPYQFYVYGWKDGKFEEAFFCVTNKSYDLTDGRKYVDWFVSYWKEILEYRRRYQKLTIQTPAEAVKWYNLITEGSNSIGQYNHIKTEKVREDLVLVVMEYQDAVLFFCQKERLGWRVVQAGYFISRQKLRELSISGIQARELGWEIGPE